MAGKTGIEWTEDTWNPIVGCSVISPGCTNCYAMKMADRIQRMEAARNRPTPYAGTTTQRKAGPVWNGTLRQAPEATLLQPLRWKRPRMIFVNSMSDLFHDSVPDEWIDQVFAVMALCPQHTFQVLTKRAARMRDYMKECEERVALLTLDLACATGTSLDKPRQHPAFREEGAFGPTIMDAPRIVGFKIWPLPNVWLGVSVEDQTRANERVPLLLATPAAVRWISAEPLLGPLDLNDDWIAPQRGCGGTHKHAGLPFTEIHGVYHDSDRADRTIITMGDAAPASTGSSQAARAA
jgi:protein gp37